MEAQVCRNQTSLESSTRGNATVMQLVLMLSLCGNEECVLCHGELQGSHIHRSQVWKFGRWYEFVWVIHTAET